jgi:hypothetical protein
MKRFNFLAMALGAGAAPLLLVLSAKADLAQMNDGAPLIFIKSNGGQITVHPGAPDGMVRVPGNAPGVQMNRFNVNRDAHGKFVLPQIRGAGVRPFAGGPRPFNIPQRQFTVPNLREGPHGVQIDNPGGDLPVGVPTRFEGMVINAGASPVLMEQTRGPYLIVGQSDVTLHGVAGNGWVRTSGNVEVRNPMGAMGLEETGAGRISMQSGPALERAVIVSANGDIEWTINGVGGGPYRIRAGTGLVKIFVRAGVGANIDATSTGGSVVSYLDPTVANVTLARPHAVSLIVGGGGAQITVESAYGNVVIAPAQ